MTRIREYIWYLEPRGDIAYSNEVLGKNIDEENASTRICADGEHHNLWQCPSVLVFMLWRSRTGLSKLGRKFAVRIFCQEGEGKIRDVTRIFKNERGSPKKKGKKKVRRTQ